MKRITTKLLSILVVCATAAHARGNTIQYTITDLGVIGTGPESFPTAMNNVGQVVGYADTYTHYSHAFLYSGSGPLINLGSFGGDNSLSIAKAINNQGMVVGYSDSSNGNTQAFLYTQSGGMQGLGTLGGPNSDGEGVNNLGQVVGVAQVPSGTYDGFLYSGNGPMVDLGADRAILINDASQVVAVNGPAGALQTYISSGGTGNWLNIGSLGGTETSPNGMNNRGDIVGLSTSSAGGAYNAFLYSGGTMADLGTFGGQVSSANGVNDFGVVVGFADLPGDLVGDGFVYFPGGEIQDLNNLVDPALGWTIDDAVAINDQGQIAAEANQENGYFHAVLLTPTPEPSSLCLLTVAGFIFLAVRGRTSLRRLWGSDWNSSDY